VKWLSCLNPSGRSLPGGWDGGLWAGRGLVEVWRYRPVVTQKVVETLTVFDQALNTTHDGLAIVGQVVQTTTVDIAALQTTTQALA
jgi:hypothetical protein